MNSILIIITTLTHAISQLFYAAIFFFPTAMTSLEVAAPGFFYLGVQRALT